MVVIRILQLCKQISNQQEGNEVQNKYNHRHRYIVLGF